MHSSSVAIVLPYLDGEVLLGIEREAVRLANGLTYEGDEVTIVTTNEVWNEERDATRPSELANEVRVTRLDGRFPRELLGFQASGAPLWIRGLAEAVRGADQCVIYNAGWPVTLLLARVGGRKWPAVAYRPYWHPPRGRISLLNTARSGLASAVFRHSDLLSVSSEAEARHLRGLLGRKDPPVVVLEPGVDPPARDPSVARELRRRVLDCGERTALVVQIGSPGAFKGTASAIAAVEELRRRRTDCRLLLIGGTDQDGWLRAAFGKAGVPDWVSHVGRVGDTEKSEYLAAGDVLVMLSEYEAYGFAALEALAHGVRAVLWSDLAAAGELSAHGARLVERSLGPVGVANAIAEEASVTVVTVEHGWTRFVRELRAQLHGALRRPGSG